MLEPELSIYYQLQLSIRWRYKDKAIAVQVINLLDEITATLAHDNKLTDEEDSLRKALGYGWSVAIVHAPAEGKKLLKNCYKKTLSISNGL